MIISVDWIDSNEQFRYNVINKGRLGRQQNVPEVGYLKLDKRLLVEIDDICSHNNLPNPTDFIYELVNKNTLTSTLIIELTQKRLIKWSDYNNKLYEALNKIWKYTNHFDQVKLYEYTIRSFISLFNFVSLLYRDKHKSEIVLTIQ